MKAKNKGQLVRGVLGIGNSQSVCVSTDPMVAETFGTIIAYTHWYRHDEDLTVLESELESLVRSYAAMPKTSVISYGYEYKPYR